MSSAIRWGPVAVGVCVGGAAVIVGQVVWHTVTRSRRRGGKTAATAGATEGMAAPELWMGEEEVQEIGAATARRALQHCVDVASGKPPVNAVIPDVFKQYVLAHRFHEDGKSPEAVLKDVWELLKYPLGNGHPRCFGWIVGGMPPVALQAEFLAHAVNTYGAFCFGFAGPFPPSPVPPFFPPHRAQGPSVTRVCCYLHPLLRTFVAATGGDNNASIYTHEMVGRWLADVCGFPAAPESTVIVSGGSMANLNALCVARSWYCQTQLGVDVRADGVPPGLRLYASDQAHSSIVKSVEMLGLGRTALVTVATNDDFTLNATALADAVARDRGAGLHPFAIVAVAGTTNTGAVDPLRECARIAAANHMWFHVDGAWGGVFTMDDRVSSAFDGLSAADSFIVNPHKALNSGLDCAVVMLRDGNHGRQAFTTSAAYLPAVGDDAAGANLGDAYTMRQPFERHFELSKRERAVKVYAVLSTLGRSGLRRMLRRFRDMAAMLRQALEAKPETYDVYPAGVMPAVCFRVREDGERVNDLLAKDLQEGGEFLASPTRLRGALVQRVCVNCWATTDRDIQALFEYVGRRVAVHRASA